MNRAFRSKPLLAAVLLSCTAARAQDVPDLTNLSLESLLKTRVSAASKFEQEQRAVPATINVITRADIRAYGWRSVSEALTSLPGFYLTWDRQYDFIGMRGLGLPGDYNTRILLAINGNRVNDVLYDAALAGRELPLDLELVERIEVLSGPGGAIYGQNAMFAVVNIVTRNGQQVDGSEASVSYQSRHQRSEANVRWGKVLENGTDVLLSLSALDAVGDDLQLEFPGAGPKGSTLAGPVIGLDGEQDADLFTRLSKGGLSFDLVAGSHRRYDPTGIYFSDPFTPGLYQSDKVALANMQYQHQSNADTLLVSRLFAGHSYYEARQRHDGNYAFSTGSSNWLGGEARALYSGFADHQLVVGIEAQSNSHIEQGYDDLSTPEQDVLIAETGHRLGIYLQDQWQFSASMSAVVGVRADKNSMASRTHYSPRAALIWNNGGTTTARAMYGQAFRAPNAFERDFDDGISQIANPLLAGERLDTYELQLERPITPSTLVRISWYHWNMPEIISLASVPAPSREHLPAGHVDMASEFTQFQPGNRITTNGVELSLNGVLAASGQWKGSITWQDADKTDGSALINSPKLLGRLNYNHLLGWGGLRAGFELRYDGDRVATDGTDIAGNWRVNLNLSTPTTITGLDAALTITNLFDARYEHPASEQNWQRSLPQDRRGIRLQLSYRF
jgi:outer membrane receptor protein involved in Fe transport